MAKRARENWDDLPQSALGKKMHELMRGPSRRPRKFTLKDFEETKTHGISPHIVMRSGVTPDTEVIIDGVPRNQSTQDPAGTARSRKYFDDKRRERMGRALDGLAQHDRDRFLIRFTVAARHADSFVKEYKRHKALNSVHFDPKMAPVKLRSLFSLLHNHGFGLQPRKLSNGTARVSVMPSPVGQRKHDSLARSLQGKQFEDLVLEVL